MIHRNARGEAFSITIPVPTVAPLGFPVDSAALVQDVWDAYIKPGQERGDPQSGEERMLMAILRSVYQGLDEK